MSMIEFKKYIMAMWIVHNNDYGNDESQVNSDGHGHRDVTIKGMVTYSVIITFKARLTVSVMLL